MTARHRSRRRLRAIVARAGALFVSLVLLVGIARGGARYFYCPMMGAAMTDACCASAHSEDGAGQDGPAFDAPECCKSRRLGTLPSAAGTATEHVDEAPLARILPPCTDLTLRRPPRADAVLAHDARAGPSAPARHRASLMIWNC